MKQICISFILIVLLSTPGELSSKKGLSEFLDINSSVGARSEVDDAEWLKAEECTTPDEEDGKCVQMFSCPSLLHLFANPPRNRISYVKKFICGNEYDTVQVCCPRVYRYVKKLTKPLSGKTYCGLQHTDDYFSSSVTDETGIDEFPWIAALMHLVFNGDGTPPFESIYCQGALINEKYVLTSAGCIYITDQSYQPWVRLGENNYKNRTDCVHFSYGTDCNEPEDFDIQEAYKHPFHNVNDYVYPRFNNLGLLRLNRSVSYSEYIRPICIPFQDTVLPRAGDALYSSGWSKSTHSEEKTIVKRKSTLTLTDDDECLKVLGSRFPPIAKIDTIPASRDVTNYFMCGLGRKVLCSYTDGEPVMFSKRSQWYLIAISTWNVPCNTTVPARYTKIVHYLDWIGDTIDSLNKKYDKH
ncbi:hypothetical protein FQR65_LT02198 [Abscondita terminalis]|nr:hypothetical protein FQR65_LT02198 [Abscondita terminalis]